MSEGVEPIRLVYMTVGSEDEARDLARLVVKERLAACANVLSGVTSVYEWQGALHEEAEWLVLMKTPSSRFPLLRERLVAAHSYDCPCVVSVPIDGGHGAFLDWVHTQTGTRSPRA